MRPMSIVVEWWVARVVLRAPRASAMPRDVLRALLKQDSFAQLSDGSIVDIERSFSTEAAAREYIASRQPNEFVVAFWTDATI